ncbi:cupin domain-containing protein [uncultured Anaerococcus sp.]|uniref:cupin domain-containing protein n=1 Tax=uncultured Anaerococcus sp. TaxID=293428 RepID=UPI00260FA789|nr:cupin domain-containing protein [uncultured Anaerococcus sp.]
MEVFNFLANLKFSTQEEVEELVYEDEKTRILRTLSLNQVTDFMTQDEDEAVLLLDGLASIETPTGTLRMKRGDFLFIPKGTRHRVVDQERAVWLCIFHK